MLELERLRKRAAKPSPALLLVCSSYFRLLLISTLAPNAAQATKQIHAVYVIMLCIGSEC